MSVNFKVSGTTVNVKVTGTADELCEVTLTHEETQNFQ